jgi:glycyl-tRNA synthetase beta chain
MPEFFLELFSEEIPARMQRDAGIQLEKICASALAPLKINIVEVFTGPRRIALKAILNAQTEAKHIEERGPRDTAPEAALAGFLGKHKASREDVVAEGGYFLLRRIEAAVTATDLIATALPAALAKFSWPKSMRWGQSGPFTWVRPLRHIVCLFDAETIPFTLGPITAGNKTEGHRFLSPGAFTVSSASDWQTKLRDRHVIADQSERRALIIAGLTEKAAALNLTLADDPGLIDEVTGLVEWPVPLIGKIDADFMDLPPEVRELSMKVNQRYFALRDSAGNPAPYFAFISNIEAKDGGAAIIAGNQRVLRARLSDARHFWDLDLKTPLNELLPKLYKIVFHADIGTQGERSERIATLATEIASALGADENLIEQVEWAGKLSKADLVTGMVGEFPELQGIIGAYYAEINPRGWNGGIVGDAIRTHYQPKGPSDEVPNGVVGVSVALADKLDTLIRFFAINQGPTGSGDPFALRRAALGVIRIILDNQLHLNLRNFYVSDKVLSFITERLRVKLRNEGQRFDVLDAVLAVGHLDNLVRIMDRVSAVDYFLDTPDGENLLIAYRRCINILKIEDTKDGPHVADPAYKHFLSPEADDLQDALAQNDTGMSFNRGDFHPFLAWLAKLRAPVDAFFEKVTINDPDPKIRRNHLALLAQLRDTMHLIADFSKIEG